LDGQLIKALNTEINRVVKLTNQLVFTGKKLRIERCFGLTKYSTK